MNALDKAIYDALAGSTALTSLLAGGTASPSVYQWLAPEGQDPPYVVYNAQSVVPVHTLTQVAYENAVYQVRGVTLGPSAAAAGTIAEMIDDALADRAITVAGHALMYLRRMSNVDFPEVGPGGQRYHHRGALYRVMVDPN
jgi:hypothetical protein